MKLLKLITVTICLLLLTISCSQDDLTEQIQPSISTEVEEIEAIETTEGIALSSSNMKVKTNLPKSINNNNRVIVAQFFEGRLYNGRSHAVSYPFSPSGNYPRALNFTLPFDAQSYVIQAGFDVQRRNSFRIEVHHEGQDQYHAAIPPQITPLIEKGALRMLRFGKAYPTYYAGQLFSKSGYSQVPVWAKLNLYRKDGLDYFNDNVGAFAPATRSRWNHLLMRKDFENSKILALIPVNGHNPNRSHSKVHRHVGKHATLIEPVSRVVSPDLLNSQNFFNIVYARLHTLFNRNPARAEDISFCFHDRMTNSFINTNPGAAFTYAVRCGVPGAAQVNVIPYQPSSGVKLLGNDPWDTYLIGSYNKDLRKIIQQLKYPKIKASRVQQSLGPPPGQHYNILNDDDGEFQRIFDTYGPGAFFRMVNAKWVDNAVRKKRIIKSVTHPSCCLRNRQGKLSGFGKEVHRLEHVHRYRWHEQKKQFVPFAQAPNKNTWTHRKEGLIF